ncbi:VOC family protein [Microbacterium pseudoresistens]|uniref:PhnB protein n=1 Tax=Microbacterium pseudoresistens TaxID=640634 RepID=A0A7Y9ETB9_9MICO|nr:VOC family protein [Microbacterium pseudoresistens]NYD53565.1 PhnB protein [Microbacterium pseudoresistens]
MTTLNPYLSFQDSAREAMEFYQSALGGDLEISTFGEMPDMAQDDSQADLVMHAQLTTDDGLVLMASDTPAGMPHLAPQGISVSLSGSDLESLRTTWDRLSDGGTVVEPFVEAPWGGWFGMFTDRFGISWMIAAGEDWA